MTLVNRESVGLLDDSWDVLGVYILLGLSEDDPDCYQAYVGEVSKRTLLLRIKEHAGGKPWWSRALHITSASDAFNSAEIGWLEGQLYDVLNSAVSAEVMNMGRPGDESLALENAECWSATSKNSPTGRAVFLTKIPAASVRIVQIIPGPRTRATS